MPVLANAKYEQFAQDVAAGKDATNSYLETHPDSSYDAARSSASSLLAKPNVRARVAELLEERLARINVTADMIAEEAWNIAKNGKVEVARVSALTLLAKRHKEFSEKHILSGDPENPVTIERRTRSTR